MPLHEKIICSYILIAEKILSEADTVPSAIRLVDVFSYGPLPPTLPPGLPQPAVQMALLFIAKFPPKSSDRMHHVAEIRLLRPNGEITTIGEPYRFVLADPAIPEAPDSLNLIVPQLGVLIKQQGVHYFTVSLDGVEVARTPFTLRENPPAPAQ